MSRRALPLLFGALALLGLLACALVALRQPASGGDYVAIWGVKARALARSGSPAALARVDPSSLASHPEYPPLWPALLALFCAPLGRYDDLVVTLLWPALCGAAALLAARATRAGVPARALAAAVVALLPFWRVPLYVGYADGLLAVLLLAALPAAAEPRRDGALFVLLLLASLTKQEGALAAVVFAVVLAASRRARGALLAGAAALLGVVPWTLYITSRLAAPPARDFSLARFVPARVGTALSALLAEAGWAGAAWLAALLALLALAPATRRRSRGLLAGVALYVLALAASFAFSVRDVAWHVRWTWDRLAFVPIALLVPALAQAAEEAVRKETVERA